jgi:guanylate kinase
MSKDPSIQGKCIIFSAPSGAGKTTIVRALLDRFDQLSFSISACSRQPRPNEINGKDYYFLSAEAFRKKIKADEFIEWEEVYKDHYYGTLRNEVERLWKTGKTVVFDVDVYGGIQLKKYFGANALSFFVEAPSLEELETRLRNRQTETEEKIQTRMQKAQEELEKKEQFDRVVVNDRLEDAINTVVTEINEYIG